MRHVLKVLALSLPLAALAGDGSVSAVVPGKAVFGPPVSQASLQGKVVMIEFWGTH